MTVSIRAVTNSENAGSVRASARTVRSFAIVGGAGFAIEAILMTALTQFAGWSAWYARIPSFVAAVLATWLLNRTLTFTGRGLQRRSTEALLYGVIQLCGAGINLTIFALCLLRWPQLARLPVVPLAIGALGAFAWNFAASNGLLYARRRTQVDG
jgi:putative flippase GtrA